MIPCGCNEEKVITQDFPAGVIGNPHAVPQCTTVQLVDGRCPSDSQIGVVAVVIGEEIGGPNAPGFLVFPLYTMVPPPDKAGVTAFTVFGYAIYTQLSARTDSDYGLRAVTSGLGRFVPVYGFNIYLWGVPSLPVHDALRYAADGQQGSVYLCNLGPIGDPRKYLKEDKQPPPAVCGGFVNRKPVASSSPPVPLLSNPTTCAGPLTAFLDTEAFDHGFDHAETPYPAITGCDQLSFNPSLVAKPTTTEADSASGLDVDLKVPQFQNATTPSPSEIRAVSVRLPEGFTINPNAADGKTTCSAAQSSIGTELAAECPEHSKIGTLVLNSSALPGPLPGYMYLGEPLPGDRYRVILAADGFATHIKLAGSAIPDPDTGRLTISFPDLPQSPLTEFNLHVFGSERGLLATPEQCGGYAVTSTFTPWDSELGDQTSTQFFTLDHGPTGSPCPGFPRPFASSFEAASAQNTAGAHSTYAINLERADGTQNLAGLSVANPLGLSAVLKGVPYCPDAAIAAAGNGGYSGVLEQTSSVCPAASLIGTAVAGAGAGTHPLHVPGKVYLAGPYKDAPLSLVVIVPAVSGPYDLGTIAVRVALYVDPVTARVTAVSDPLPSIVAGIPLRTRSIQVRLDRPNFVVNPTDCDPLSVDAKIAGDEGDVQSIGRLYQAANCASLGYEPSLELQLSGGLNRLGHPAIHADLKTAPGDANTRRISVTLPPGELLDNSHLETICTRVQFAARTCPKGSLVGNVKVTTPLLDAPLTGNVYLRSSTNDLPDLALDLEGQIDIEAAGRIDSVKGRLRTTFESIPDVPFSRIQFNLIGGKRGLLQNSKGLCGAAKRARVKMTGQNEVQAALSPKLETDCRNGKAGRR
jgi:hypothetical protein